MKGKRLVVHAPASPHTPPPPAAIHLKGFVVNKFEKYKEPYLAQNIIKALRHTRYFYFNYIGLAVRQDDM